MNLFHKIKEIQEKKANERNQKCDELIAGITEALNEANSYIANKSEFVDISLADTWKNKYAGIIDSATDKTLKSLKKADRIETLRKNVDSIRFIVSSIRTFLEKHNENLANRMIDDAYALIGNVEGRKLDRQQMLAIVKEAHNHLIIAGAGTGKTTTVVGKIKYLLKSGKYKPEDLLVLSFTNASASEMSERIAKETSCNIAASTFHKLGLNVITKVEGIKPKISQINLRSFIREKIQELIKDHKYLKDLSAYLLNNRVQAKAENEFKSEEEYKEYIRLNPPLTILNERVKSYGEMNIANFLLLNGIEYKYEAEYKTDTRTNEHGQYYPDFYLPEYDIYIEYFGIDKNGNVPAWFSGKDGKSASELYRESMEWKRELHKENNTVLIECYAYEAFNGELLPDLEYKLKKEGVIFKPKDPEEVWKLITKDNDTLLDGLIELFETVINLMKSNNYSVESFKEIASKTKDSARYLSFIKLIEPLVKAYEQQLRKTGEIDFNDMINKATEYVLTGKYKNSYSYVIVDEYQDISKARFSLLAALRSSMDYDLFCVGDDWQSIYRFAGSDISYILNFEEFWGPATISKIETTYRFTKSLIEISGVFIMQNPDQIRKSIKGMSPDSRFSMGEIKGYNEKFAVEFMAERLDNLPQNASVFFIGRYSFDVDIIDDKTVFDCQYNNVTGFVDVKYNKRPDLKMCFVTAHKSKGLQADYVFIINNKNSRMGFPSKIQDDPILNLLLDNSESFPFAEERRLYYVAITRAKVKAFLLTVKENESSFVKELETRYGNQLRQERFECPLCGGKLTRKTGPYGDFFGCENYRITGCKYVKKIRSKTNT